MALCRICFQKIQSALQVHIFSGRPPQFLEECSPLIAHKHIVRLDRTGISQRQGQSAQRYSVGMDVDNGVRLDDVRDTGRTYAWISTRAAYVDVTPQTVPVTRCALGLNAGARAKNARRSTSPCSSARRSAAV